MNRAQKTKKKNIALIRGIVRHGDKRGRELGYPTANLDLHQDIPTGIYCSRTKVKGVWMPSMTYVGQAETFGQHKKRVETHILDFQGDLYDQWISVEFLHYLHESEKFVSVEALIESMQRDEKATRTFLGL